jgi:uroporphyrinogen decarboxylase
MKSRERVQRAISFQRPDRMPLHHIWAPEYPDHPEFAALLKAWPTDFACGWTAHDPQVAATGKNGGVDDFGCQWTNVGHGPLSTGHPLADWSAFPNWRPPDPDDYLRLDPLPDLLARRDDWYAAPWGGHIFERLISLRGYQGMFLDFAEEPPQLPRLIEMLVEHNEKYLRRWLAHDIDGVTFSDDLGSRTQLMISPAHFRKYLKPAYKHLYDLVHARGLTVHLHSDGCILEIIEDLIEIGLDLINCQVYANGTEELGRRFGGRICFQPDPGRQDLLPFGAPDEIEAEVKRWVNCFGGERGGLIGASFPMIGPVPFENAERLFRSLLKYGCGYHQALAAS